MTAKLDTTTPVRLIDQGNHGYESERLTKIYHGQSFSIVATPHKSSSIVVTRISPLPFVMLPSKMALFMVNPDRESLCFVVIRSHSWSTVVNRG